MKIVWGGKENVEEEGVSVSHVTIPDHIFFFFGLCDADENPAHRTKTAQVKHFILDICAFFQPLPIHVRKTSNIFSEAKGRRLGDIFVQMSLAVVSVVRNKS